MLFAEQMRSWGRGDPTLQLSKVIFILCYSKVKVVRVKLFRVNRLSIDYVLVYFRCEVSRAEAKCREGYNSVYGISSTQSPTGELGHISIFGQVISSKKIQ